MRVLETCLAMLLVLASACAAQSAAPADPQGSPEAPAPAASGAPADEPTPAASPEARAEASPAPGSPVEAGAAPPQAAGKGPRSAPGASAVLCYHHVEDTANNDYTVTTEEFAAQMQYLKDNGFAVVPLARLVEAHAGKGTLPARAVAITFDDGWRCANTKALPILKKLGLPATLFLYPQMIGEGRHKSTWDEYKAIIADPLFTVGCHSWSHPNLFKDGGKLRGDAYRKFLQREYVASKARIEEKLGVEVKWLAYPYGLYDAEVARVLKEAGYEAAFTVCGAPNAFTAEPLYLNRMMIMRGDGMKGFTRKVSSLPLAVDHLKPADGAAISPRTRTFSARVVDPDADPDSVKLSVAGRGKSTMDPASGVVTLTLDRPLGLGAHYVNLTGRDRATGRARHSSWMIRVKDQVAPAPARPAEPAGEEE